jgi:hypothetical protein
MVLAPTFSNYHFLYIVSLIWSPDSEFSWSLMVDGLDEDGQSERVAISPKNFPKYKVSNICMRVMVQPISIDKLKITIGIAPVPYESLKKTNDVDNIGFPLVEIHTLNVDIFPIMVLECSPTSLPSRIQVFSQHQQT